MTQRHIMDKRARRSKRYKALHEQLEREVRKPSPSKRDLKRQASADWRQNG